MSYFLIITRIKLEVEPQVQVPTNTPTFIDSKKAQKHSFMYFI